VEEILTFNKGVGNNNFFKHNFLKLKENWGRKTGPLLNLGGEAFKGVRKT